MRLPHGTAKDISEIADVPRTRVYDAVEQLQAYDLVHMQHASPQQYRAVPIDVATQILQHRFDVRITELYDLLESLTPVDIEPHDMPTVWPLSTAKTITT